MVKLCTKRPAESGGDEISVSVSTCDAEQHLQGQKSECVCKNDGRLVLDRGSNRLLREASAGFHLHGECNNDTSIQLSGGPIYRTSCKDGFVCFVWIVRYLSRPENITSNDCIHAEVLPEASTRKRPKCRGILVYSDSLSEMDFWWLLQHWGSCKKRRSQ